jgi:hypothetical protein
MVPGRNTETGENMTQEEKYIKQLEGALKVIWVWAKNNDLDRGDIMKLCDRSLNKLFIHELPGVKRNRLVDLGG